MLSEREKKIINEFKNSFKNHHVKLERIDEDFCVLDWQEPNVSDYKIRYILDGTNLFVTGDLGSAVFNLSWNGARNLGSFKNINPETFHKKLETFKCAKSNKVFEFSGEQAKEVLEETIQEIEELMLLEEEQEFEDKYKEHIEVLETLKEVAENCNTNQEWIHEITYENYDIGDKYDFPYETLTKYDNEAWEWIYRVGEVIPKNVFSYLVGLQMAYDLLKLQGNEEV